MRLANILLFLLVAAAKPSAPPELPLPTLARAKEATAGGRKVVNRTLVFDDQSTIPEVHLAKGIPTTLSFPVKLAQVAVRDDEHLLYKERISNNVLVLTPKETLPKGQVVPVSVTLEDNSVLSFLAVSDPAQVDYQLAIEVKFQRAAPASVESLKQTIAELQSRLDELQSDSPRLAVRQITSLVLSQDPQSPAAKTFTGYTLHGADKQSHLVLRVHHLYRLFRYSYLLLTVQNRDPSKVWVLDHPELRFVGSAETQTITILSFESEKQSLGPEELSKIAVAFESPAQTPGQKIIIRLVEKGGPRQAEIEFEP